MNVETLQKLSTAFNEAVFAQARKITPPVTQEYEEKVYKRSATEEEAQNYLKAYEESMALQHLFSLDTEQVHFGFMLMLGTCDDPIRLSDFLAELAINLGREMEFTNLAAKISREQGIFPDDAGEAYQDYEGKDTSGVLISSERIDNVTQELWNRKYNTPNMAKLYGF